MFACGFHHVKEEGLIIIHQFEGVQDSYLSVWLMQSFQFSKFSHSATQNLGSKIFIHNTMDSGLDSGMIF